RRRTRTITVLSTLLVLALIATGLAVWQQQAARSAQRTAIAQAMVARADQVRDRDPRGALQLGVAARHFAASPQTHASLRQTLASNSHFTTFYGHDGTVNGAVFAPDGRTLATTSADETVKLWDVSDRDRPRQLGQPLTGHTDGASGWRLPPMGAPWPPPAMTALSDCGMSVIVSGPGSWVSHCPTTQGAWPP
ncbi:MAG: WD40 repeat domain-containing protein, partial [Pseudonocardiaceae bacterium]